MYAKRLVEEKLAAYSRKLHWDPVYHSIEQIKEFKEYVDKVTTIVTNSRNSYVRINRPMTENKKRTLKLWIQNEQILCASDAHYWLTRYAFITDEKGDIFQFNARVSQEIFFQLVAHFEDLEVAIEIFCLKARQVGLCLHPDTRVLTADLRWVRIDDLQVGDEVVAVDEEIPALSSKKLSRKMRTGAVEAKRDVFDFAVKIEFEDGRSLTATRDHRFLLKQPGGTNAIWRKVRDFRIGDEIRYVCEPWDKSDYEDGWMGGMIDGEGHLSKASRKGSNLGICQVEGAVLTRARKYFESRKYSVREEIDDRQPGEGTKLGKQRLYRLVLSRMDEIFRLIGQTRPAKHIGNRWWEGKDLPGKRSGIGWSKIVSIELLPHQRMIDIQTSTKTFIAEGFVSHNSTMTALMFLHRMLFIPNTQAVMASVQQDKSELIARILQTCYQRCPWWLVPRQNIDRIGKMGFANSSVLSIQSGMQATGIAQGWTPTCVHVSELADIPNPKKTIEEGLLRATHSSRKLFQVFEGTGGGSTGWQADFWRTAKEGFPLGQSRFCPLFIPWPLATDLYPEADWLKKFPIPERWAPLKETRKHVQRCELYIQSTPFLSAVAGENWKMPRRQQWFWEFNYLDAVKKHTERVWASQMPADDLEALTGKNDTVFANDVIEVQRETRSRTFRSYAVLGKSIDDGFEPDDTQIDYEAERIEIEWTSHRGEHFSWILVPLLDISEEEETPWLDRLIVYEHPKQGRDYAIGIDTADGMNKPDEDRFVMNVSERAKGNFPDVQCAELTSLRINPAQAVGFAAAMGAWYGEKCRDPRGVKFCIEQRDRPGDDCQHQLKMMGFLYHHRMIRYDNRKVDENASNKDGWYSGAWSVPILMGRFVDAVNNGWYKANSKWLIRELGDLERKITAAGRSKMEHQSGKKDDRVRAAALSYITGHHMDVLAERSHKTYALRKGNVPEFNEEYAKISAMSVGD